MVLITLVLVPVMMQSRPVEPVPSYEVRRASGRIKVDGKLDEAAWQKAATLEFVFPWEKQRGAKQKTTARLLWDDRFLHVGFECQDSDIVAQLQQRDDPTYRDDAVEIFINPRPSKNIYFGLEMNARAVLYDYLYAFPDGHFRGFDLRDVQLATHLRGTLNATGDTDEGWSLELAIPWDNFEDFGKMPPAPDAEWRANLNRWDGTEPNRRLSQWSDSGLDTPNPHNPARFGRLIFKQ